eukprot:scaffold502601_cov43-Prasinocladus_malaysianus.AAC.1
MIHESNCPSNIEPFCGADGQVAGCSHVAGGPAAGRARRLNGGKKLLEGTDIVLLGRSPLHAVFNNWGKAFTHLSAPAIEASL